MGSWRSSWFIIWRVAPGVLPAGFSQHDLQLRRTDSERGVVKARQRVYAGLRSRGCPRLGGRTWRASPRREGVHFTRQCRLFTILLCCRQSLNVSNRYPPLRQPVRLSWETACCLSSDSAAADWRTASCWSPSGFSPWASFYGDTLLLHLRVNHDRSDVSEFRVSFLEETS